jgi:hypothetical protein
MSVDLWDAVVDSLADWTQPDYRGTTLSMSMLGVCRRQAAYAAAGYDSGPDESTAAADVGSLIHAALLPRLADRAGGSHEVPVLLELCEEHGGRRWAIPGTADLVTEPVVLDLKTVSDRHWAILRDLKRTWRFQVTAAALAVGAPDAAVLVLNRDTGDWRIEEVDVDATALELTDWLASVGDPDDPTMRDHRGPGIDRECDWCPFLAQCWPEQPEGQARQAVRLHEDASVTLAMESYDAARTRVADATADLEFWRAVLTGAPAGDYEGGWRLTWSKRTTSTLDRAEAERLLGEVGLPVPVTTRSSTSIGVKRAPS